MAHAARLGRDGAQVRAIFGFRNRIVHPHDRVDERIVFGILTEERAAMSLRAAGCRRDRVSSRRSA